MKKRIMFIVCAITLVSVSFTGCATFEETYKPLYQVKPTVEKIEEE